MASFLKRAFSAGRFPRIPTGSAIDKATAVGGSEAATKIASKLAAKSDAIAKAIPQGAKVTLPSASRVSGAIDKVGGISNVLGGNIEPISQYWVEVARKSAQVALNVLKSKASASGESDPSKRRVVEALGYYENIVDTDELTVGNVIRKVFKSKATREEDKEGSDYTRGDYKKKKLDEQERRSKLLGVKVGEVKSTEQSLYTFPFKGAKSIWGSDRPSGHSTKEDNSRFELDSTDLWDISLEPYENENENIEAFAPDLSSKYEEWIPCIGYELTDTSIGSKELDMIEGSSISIPTNKIFSKSINLTLLEDSAKTFYYYKKQYINRIVRDDYSVMPYKNVCTKITIYRFDPSRQRVYRKVFLGVPRDWSLSNSATSDPSEITIDLEFSIVGELGDENLDYTESSYYDDVQEAGFFDTGFGDGI